MLPDDATIREVADLLCETVIQDVPCHERAAVAPVGPFVVGRVHIHGAWVGTVTLACAGSLARRAAGHLLDLGEAEVTDDDVRDAVGDMTNILGGGVKALLPSPSRLSIPVVSAEGAEAMAALPAGADGAERSLWFSCGGEPMVLRLRPGSLASESGGGP